MLDAAVIGRQHGLSEDRRKLPLLKKQQRYSPSRASGLSQGVDNIVCGGARNLLRSGMEGRREDRERDDDDCCQDESGSDAQSEEGLSNRDIRSPELPELECNLKDISATTAMSGGSLTWKKQSACPVLPGGTP